MKMRVALVHDWLTGMRGGERVLEALCERYPEAELFTLLHVPGSVTPSIEQRPIHTSALQSLPGIRHYYRECLPLFPVLVDPYDPRAIADGIHGVLTDEDLRRSLRQKGLARAQQFSWEKSVRRVREIYAEAADL